MPATAMMSKARITVRQPVPEHPGVVAAVGDLYRLRPRPARRTVSLEEIEPGIREYLAADDHRIRRGAP